MGYYHRRLGRPDSHVYYDCRSDEKRETGVAAEDEDDAHRIGSRHRRHLTMLVRNRAGHGKGLDSKPVEAVKKE